MAEASDAELLIQAKAGDRDAWSTLCHRHAPRLAAYLGARLHRAKVVEKLVEEAIVLAFKHLDEIARNETFAAWFRRLGANLALSWYKENPDEPLAEPFPSERCGDDAQAKRLTRLDGALAKLSDAQRMAVEQRFRAKLSGDDLAEVLHSEPAKVDRLVDDALAVLARAWENESA